MCISLAKASPPLYHLHSCPVASHHLDQAAPQDTRSLHRSCLDRTRTRPSRHQKLPDEHGKQWGVRPLVIIAIEAMAMSPAAEWAKNTDVGLHRCAGACNTIGNISIKCLTLNSRSSLNSESATSTLWLSQLLAKER